MQCQPTGAARWLHRGLPPGLQARFCGHTRAPVSGLWGPGYAAYKSLNAELLPVHLAPGELEDEEPLEAAVAGRRWPLPPGNKTFQHREGHVEESGGEMPSLPGGGRQVPGCRGGNGCLDVHFRTQEMYLEDGIAGGVCLPHRA